MLTIHGMKQYNGMMNFGCDWQFEEICHAQNYSCQTRDRKR